jgi:hypothetical protein
MDRQSKEKMTSDSQSVGAVSSPLIKLHLMQIELLKAHNAVKSGVKLSDLRNFPPAKEEIACSVEKHIYYFWVFGHNIDEQLKLVCFELNRLYMRSKDFRTGYKVLKK